MWKSYMGKNIGKLLANRIMISTKKCKQLKWAIKASTTTSAMNHLDYHVAPCERMTTQDHKLQCCHLFSQTFLSSFFSADDKSWQKLTASQQNGHCNTIWDQFWDFYLFFMWNFSGGFLWFDHFLPPFLSHNVFQWHLRMP